jgi:hypothetical protein
MNALDRYLNDYFFNAEQLASSCGITAAELAQLIDEQLVPAASYVVSASSLVRSYVFGAMTAEGSTDGAYFHPSTSVWVAQALRVIAQSGRAEARAVVQRQFTENLARALAELDRSTWRLHDAFADDGTVREAALAARIALIWEHFLMGTFGLCVANPDSERAIARKEILQEKLSALTDNGKRERFTADEALGMLALIDAFAESAMPFSPIEYPISSRKRLVEDLRARLLTR